MTPQELSSHEYGKHNIAERPPIDLVQRLDELQPKGHTEFWHALSEAAKEAPFPAALTTYLDDPDNRFYNIEKSVISYRLGIGAREEEGPQTLEQVGEEFGVTRERIRIILKKTAVKMRHPQRLRELEDLMNSSEAERNIKHLEGLWREHEARRVAGNEERARIAESNERATKYAAALAIQRAQQEEERQKNMPVDKLIADITKSVHDDNSRTEQERMKTVNFIQTNMLNNVFSRLGVFNDEAGQRELLQRINAMDPSAIVTEADKILKNGRLYGSKRQLAIFKFADDLATRLEQSE